MAINNEELDYFETPELRRCVGKVYDSVIKERGIFYLKGPSGAGKTLFAERLTKLFASRYQVMLLAVNPMVEIQSLIRAELGLPAADDEDWPPGELVERSSDQQPLLLIIDDAELLEKQDVRALWKLYKIGVVVLFVGKGGFAGGLQLKNIYEQDIPLLTRRQCREYLSSQGISIPADGTLDEIFAKTEGKPGRIDELSLLRKWQVGEDEVEEAEGTLLSKGGMVIVGGLLLATICFWLYLEYWQQEARLPVDAVSVGTSTAIPRPPAKPYKAEPVPADREIVEPATVEVIPVQPAEVPSKPAVKLSRKITTVKPAQGSADLLTDREWLLAQDPKARTLQVAGAWEEKLLRTQADGMNLVEKYAVFVRDRQGKSWYSLVVGVYPDTATAVAANGDISARFGVSDAWVRSFAEIQKVISTQKRD